MLYILRQIRGASPATYYLISGKEYTIGRKTANIALTDDASISRKHALIKVGPNTAALSDCKSKYGTVHNGRKIEENTTVVLEDNDVIKFGVYDSVFKVEKISLVVTGSGLNTEEKSQLKSKVISVGGLFVNDWSPNVTHLIAPTILLTIKILHAIIDEKPIVNFKYWDEFTSSIHNNTDLPKTENFKPPVTEALINAADLASNPARKTLFKDKIFVFPTEKLKTKMSQLIQKAGGSCISWEKQPLSLLQVTKSKNNYLFIFSDDPNTPQSLKDIYQNLTKLGERTIPLEEIPKAIALCSCEKDCNPKFNRLQAVFMEEGWSNSESQVFALAGETQESLHSLQPKQEVIIPASLDADVHLMAPPPPRTLSTPSTSKRPDVEPPEGTPAKKAKLDESTASNSKKRKAEENSVPIPKKSMRDNTLDTFVINKKKTSDNPFAAIGRIKTEVSETNNPFKNIEVKKQVDEVEINEAPLESPSVYESPKSDISNVTWMSKQEIKNESVEIEPELREFYDRFNNSMVIEVLPPTAIRTVTPRQTQETLNTPSRKNFKKFRKVQPLRPQINIITTRALPVSTNGVSMLSDGEEDDKEEEVVRKPVLKKHFNPFKF